jgi:hypothetical protein
MTQKKESALGRGLDALIRMEPEIGESEAPKRKSDENLKSNIPKSRSGTKGKRKPRKNSAPNNTVETEAQENQIQEDLVDNVINEVNKNPRISLWSARSAAVLRLLKKTKPEFSISKEASALIEDAVKEKYPDLWEVFEDKNI